ncbi:MAG: DUF1015 domain-containing protein [Chloroflexota bacterium]|nr:DUF1015 domain-containing protein [Chloroflexota bacterium]
MDPVFDIGIKRPKILLPRSDIDLKKWAVIACDQFTSQPEYWQQVEEIVGGSPSTFHMILPEVFLGSPEEENRIQTTQSTMKDYLQSDLFKPLHDFIYVLRSTGGQTRRGLMVCLDLEHYDYNKGAQTLIRATEGTILDRLPPRIRIREKAAIECPHILVLFDDPEDTVFTPIDVNIKAYQSAYDFELMLGSGHLKGLVLDDEGTREHIFKALSELIQPENFAKKYNLEPGRYSPLLFAMGDGNHSLATAKAIWDKIKPSVGMAHPTRYALVEIENIHDPALTFEPIHRLIFNLKVDLKKAMQTYWGNNVSIREAASEDDMMTAVNDAVGPLHHLGMVTGNTFNVLAIQDPGTNLAVGVLQKFLDKFLKKDGAENIDYVHGSKVLFEKAKSANNAGFYVPAMDKSDLFRTVILDGALPRKTFSMGEAKEKRFYMECRMIQA